MSMCPVVDHYVVLSSSRRRLLCIYITLCWQSVGQIMNRTNSRIVFSACVKLTLYNFTLTISNRGFFFLFLHLLGFFVESIYLSRHISEVDCCFFLATSTAIIQFDRLPVINLAPFLFYSLRRNMGLSVFYEFTIPIVTLQTGE